MALVSLAALMVACWASDRRGPRPVLMTGLLVGAASVATLGTLTSAGSACAVGMIVAIRRDGVAGAIRAARASDKPAGASVGFGIRFMLVDLGLGMGGVDSALVVSESRPQNFVWLSHTDAATHPAIGECSSR